jgi:DNA helicase-2/ATP-dependent DNA helicase PcrA
LWVTYANTRYKFGSLVQNEPSRFIDELPEKYLDRSFAGGGAKANSGFATSAYERMNGGWGNAGQAEKKYGPPPNRRKEETP